VYSISLPHGCCSSLTNASFQSLLNTQGDEECFEAFKDIVNPVVKGWHGFDPATQYHKSDLNWKSLKFSKEQQKKFDQYVVSTRVRAARNISTFSLPPGSDEKDRLGVENVLKQAFASFSGELAGKYYPLGAYVYSRK